jgi:hypothetical protein
MPNAYQTMLDLARRSGSDRVAGLIEEVLIYAPELEIFPARIIAGTNFKTLVRVSLPVSQFRKANTGVNTGKSQWTNKTTECAYLDGQLQIDKAIADADDRGADALMTDEETGQMRSHGLNIGRQLWYGSNKKFNGQQDGFVGAIEVVDPGLVLDATGTTANGASSVWFVKVGNDCSQLIFGKDATLRINKWRLQTVVVNGGNQSAWVNALEGWAGAQWLNKNCIGRITNLTGQAGHTLTDNLGYTLLSQFPVGFKPDYAFMSRRSLEQLRQSRITALITDPPTPTSIAGVPIKVTDSIADNEPINL